MPDRTGILADCLDAFKEIIGQGFEEYRAYLQPFFSELTTDFSGDSPGGYVMDCLNTALNAFLGADDFESALVDVVNRGGDADTNGAVVGGLAEGYYGFKSVPVRWVKAFSDQQTGILDELCREIVGLQWGD